MELTIKHLSAYLPYGLKMMWSDGKIDTLNPSLDENDYKENEVRLPLVLFSISQEYNNIKPILRNLSDLTKEIEVNGERFVPMVLLAQIAGLDTTKYDLSQYDNGRGVVSYGIRCNIENDEDDDTYEVLGFDLITGFGKHYRPSKQWSIVSNQIELWECLHKWHFDIYSLIPQGLAVDMNTLNNTK